MDAGAPNFDGCAAPFAEELPRCLRPRRCPVGGIGIIEVVNCYYGIVDVKGSDYGGGPCYEILLKTSRRFPPCRLNSFVAIYTCSLVWSYPSVAAPGAIVEVLLRLALGYWALVVVAIGVVYVIRLGPGGGRLGPDEFRIVKVGEACIWLEG